jgi:hypothetical protein
MMYLTLIFLSAFAMANTKDLFEILAKTQNGNSKTEPPMKVEAENVICSKGSVEKNYSCSAVFLAEGKSVKREIIDSNNFFNYLSEKNAIALDGPMKGGALYKVRKISCRYSLESEPYYQCLSEVELKF